MYLPCLIAQMDFLFFIGKKWKITWQLFGIGTKDLLLVEQIFYYWSCSSLVNAAKEANLQIFLGLLKKLCHKIVIEHAFHTGLVQSKLYVP